MTGELTIVLIERSEQKDLTVKNEMLRLRSARQG